MRNYGDGNFQRRLANAVLWIGLGILWFVALTLIATQYP